MTGSAFIYASQVTTNGCSSLQAVFLQLQHSDACPWAAPESVLKRDLDKAVAPG